MKLFVVAGEWFHEGYDAPAGIYSTLDKAVTALTDMGRGYDAKSIFECELDATPVTLRKPIEEE